jgi:hypothetical protein
MSSSISETEREIERNGSLGSRQFSGGIGEEEAADDDATKRWASLIKKEECSSAMKKPRTFTPTKLTKR